MIRFLTIAVVALFIGAPLRAEEPAKADAPKPDDGQTADIRGYIDGDGDGVNDRFRDANGDGVNDVTGKPYPHRFRVVDEDEDGVNDLFVDRDGDGVNDLDAAYVDRDGDGVCDNVVDYDGDGVNDITGFKYSRDSLGGYRYGRVDEERGISHRRFRDEDGDGMNDFAGGGPQGRGQGKAMDIFVDEDGDGICDGRAVRGRGNRGTAWGKGGGNGDVERAGAARRRRGNSEKGAGKSGGGR